MNLSLCYTVKSISLNNEKGRSIMKNNKFLVTVGLQGSGKSTFLRETGLDKIAVSPDSLREIFFPPTLESDGELSINNEMNDVVFGILFHRIIPSRLETGAPFILDATSLRNEDLQAYKEVADKYAYDLEIIDFGLEDSIDFYIKRNENRTPYKKVPLSSLEKSYAARAALDLSDYTVKTPEEVKAYFAQNANDLLRDVSDYEKIYFIGDIQGCYSAFDKFNKNHDDKKALYVFVGDYIDRGVENGEALKFVQDNIGKENFIFLKGNHEENLYRYFMDLELRDKGFVEKTLPQLLDAGFTKESLKSLYHDLDEVVYLKYGKAKILVNHGGLGSVPKEPMFLSKNINNYGFGSYEYDIDSLFSENEKGNTWVQIHGHRNAKGLNIIASDKSFNLEGEVEFGEQLRILAWEKAEGSNKFTFKDYSVTNTVYDKDLLKPNEVELEFKKAPDSVLNPIAYTGRTSLDLLEHLRSNPLIVETPSEMYPHISAFNFTRTAFQDSENSFLQELVSQARGLFINNETGEIVSRGYEKFFNVGEVPQSTTEYVRENFVFPMIGYKKENGFFGTIGYDSKTDELIITSKSRIEGEFPDYFKNIVDNQFSQKEMGMFKRYAAKYGVNFIFEVNDPVNDPHIVEYENAHVVLLGMVKRNIKFSDVPYDIMKKFAEQFENLPLKERMIICKDAAAFEGFYNAISSGKKMIDFEGYVFEDAEMNKIKVKSPYYSSWKFMRGAKDYAIGNPEKYIQNNFLNKSDNANVDTLEKGIDYVMFLLKYSEYKRKTIKTSHSRIDSYQFISDNMKPQLHAFLDWIVEQPMETQKKNIIASRKEFLSVYTGNEKDFKVKPRSILEELKDFPFVSESVQKELAPFVEWLEVRYPTGNYKPARIMMKIYEADKNDMTEDLASLEKAAYIEVNQEKAEANVAKRRNRM